MKAIFFLIITFALSVLADNSTSFSINGKEISFLNLPGRSLTISKSCSQKKNGFKCAAFTAFQKASKLKSTQSVPPQIGADLCKQTGGEVVLGISDKKDENSFCLFAKDGSLIDLGSLYASQQGFGK